MMFLSLLAMSPGKAFAAAGDIQVTVTREAGGVDSGILVEVQCTGGTYTQLSAGTTDGSGVVQDASPGGADCTDTETVDVRVSKDGYVTKTVTEAFTFSAAADPNTVSITSFQFGHKIIIKDELNQALTPDSVTAGLLAVSCTISTNSAYCPVALGSDDAVVTGFNIVKSGYVSTGVDLAGSRAAGTDPQQVVTMSATNGMDFGQKVSVGSEVPAALTGATVTAGTSNTACTEVAGTYYCAVPANEDGTADDVTVIKTGYVTKTGSTTNRDNDGTAQGTISVTGVLFQLKVVGRSELGGAVAGAVTTTYNGQVPTAVDGGTGTFYWAVNATRATLAASVGGYVNMDTTNTSLASSGTTGVTTSAAAQLVITMGAFDAVSGTEITSSTNVKGIQFGQKITPTREADAGALTGATVTAGTSNTACTESTGVYYCAVPVAQDGTANDISVAKSGYITNTTGDTLGRTDGTSAQASVSVSGVQFSLKVWGGNELGNAVAGTVTITHRNTAPVVTDNYYRYFASFAPGALAAASDGYVSLRASTDTQVASVSVNTTTQTVITLSGTTSCATGNSITAGATVTCSGLKYGFKLLDVQDELENSLLSSTVKTGDSFGTTCTQSGGQFYCIVPLANTEVVVQVTQDGYVTDTGTSFSADRTSNSDAQQTATVTGVDFAHKVTLTQEGDSAALSSAIVTVGGTSCSESASTGVYYCATPLASDGGTADVTATKTGYISYSADSTDRAAATTAQATYTSEAQFTLKVTASVSGVTVTVTSEDDTSLSTSSPTATSGLIQYFAINPTTYPTAKVVGTKASHDTVTFTNRVISASEQRAVSLTMNSTTSGSSGGGGGGGSSQSTVCDISTIASNTEEVFECMVRIPVTGMFVRPTKVVNSATKSSISIQKDTHATKTGGSSYSGTISIPLSFSIANLPKVLPEGWTFVKGLKVDTTSEVTFDKIVTISIPLKDVVSGNVKAFYYNPTTDAYEMEGEGGTLADDGKSISFTTNHLSKFVMLQEVGTEKPAEDAPMAGPFEDTKGHWAVEFIQKLHDMKVVQGRGETTFEPDSALNRAEIVKIALLTFGYTVDETATSEFPDVTEGWYVSYVATAEKLGLVSGYPDGTFKPEADVNRAEALKILLGFAKAQIEGSAATSFTDVTEADWYAPYVKYAFAQAIVNGKSETSFAPADEISRAEMSKITVKLFELLGVPSMEDAFPY